VNDFFLSTTVNLKSINSTSSGVFVSDSQYIYLVTAKHCLFNLQNDLGSQFVSLIYYVNDPFGGKNDTITVDLKNSIKYNAILFDETNDIAIVQIGKFIGNTNTGKKLFSYQRYAKKVSNLAPGVIEQSKCFILDNTLVGEDCILAGFPTSLKNEMNNLNYNFDRPLIRKGVIAGKDKSTRTIIVDCPVYKGNSGGPVFEISELEPNKIGLIGIVSSAIILTEKLENSYYKGVTATNLTNSGYSVIIPIEYALNLMKRMNLLMKESKD